MTSPPTDEPAFADLLDELLEDLLNGDEPDLAAVAARHPLAAHRIEEAYRLAGSVAGRRSSGRPSLRGYQIVRELGRGGMGTVYLARQQDLDREVALKVLPHSFGLSEQSRRRFLEEAKALARVHHEHIVGIHRIVDDGELLAFEMEFVDGPSLHEVLAHLRAVRSQGEEPGLQHVADLLGLPPASLGAPNLITYFVRLGRAIARALGAVHAAGFVHRDVKPANILLRQNGQPVLADFGLVRDTALERSHKTGFVGTPVYSSPEQLRGGAPIGASTDVYALGVTLYECLTLAPPFAGRTTTDLLQRIESGRIPPLRRNQPHAPRDLETILAHAMELEPQRRYQDGTAFADDLQRMLDLLPIAARPASLLRRLGKFARRNRLPLAAGCLGAALVALGMVPVLDHVQAGERRQRDALEQVRLAQQDLLGSEVRRFAWQRSVWGNAARRAGADEAAATAALERARAHYERALQAQPDHGLARRDLAVLNMALWLRSVPIEHADSLQQALTAPAYRDLAASLPPLTRRLAEAAAGGTAATLELQPQLLAADAAERSCFGLLAFLIGELRWCELAWEELEVAGPDAPLHDAVLGLIALTEGAPERAFVRLRKAQHTLPKAVFALELADAALAMGETAVAEQWLGHADPTDGMAEVRRRVQADLALARGDVHGARAIYQDLARGNLLDPTPLHRLSQLALREGHLDDAARWLDEQLQQWPAMTRLRLDRGRLALQQRDVAAYLRQVLAVFVDPAPAQSIGRAADGLELLRIGGLERLQRLLAERTHAGRAGRAILGGELPLRSLLPGRVVDAIEDVLPAVGDALQRRRALLGRTSALNSTVAGGIAIAPLLANRLPGFATACPPWWNLAREALPLALDTAYNLTQPVLRTTFVPWLSSEWKVIDVPTVEAPADLEAALTYGSALVLGSDWTGDGVRELLVAATCNDPGQAAGRAVLIDGRTKKILREVRADSTEHIFAYSLAAVGDLDGDGSDEWLIGCPSGGTATRNGLVEVRSGRDGARLGTLRHEAAAFGVAVTGLGDVDGDGVADFAVGAPPIVRNATAQGCVIVFSGRTRRELRRLDNRVPGVWFGASLADVGDTDGDGVRDLAVGGNFGGAPGHVVLFSGRTGEALHTWSDESTGSGFGVIVNAVGDLDGDGHGDVAISAVRTDPEQGTDQVFVHSGRTGALLVGLRGDRPGAQFGLSVTGYRSGHGRTLWLAIGAPLGGDGRCGSVLVCDDRGQPLSTLLGPGALSHFGTWVVAGDDVDGDGRSELFLAGIGMPLGKTVSRIDSRTMQFPY